MTEKKNLDGPVPVNSSVTPVTKQQVREVQAHRWHEMSVNELYNQKAILYGRFILAAQLANYPLMQQLQMGIDILLELINTKLEQDIKII